MRNSTYFSIIRNSIVDLVKRSTDTTDSKTEINEAKIEFYREFIDKKRLRSCKIFTTETIPRLKFQRTYALYNIEVFTEDIKYQIKKRYSEFQQFYNRTLSHSHKELEFPKKTIFQSGSSQEVTSERLAKLNKLIEKLIQQDSSQATKIEFFDFLQLYDKYEQNGISNIQEQVQIPVTDQYLMKAICKLNENPKNTLKIFQNIKLSIFDRKRRINYDIAKQLMIGFQDYQGLIPIIISNQNILIVRQGLKLLNELLSAETCRQYETFGRILQKFMPHTLILNQQNNFFDDSQLKIAYFSLIKHFLSLRQDIEVKALAKYYQMVLNFENNYNIWQKYFSLYSGH